MSSREVVVGLFDAQLRFDEPSPDGSSLRVALHHDRVHATTRVRLRDRYEIVRFFDELATDWRGWSGERGYQSEDLELDMACWHDGIGEVVIYVEMRSTFYLGDPAHPDWSATAWLTVEPGALQTYASTLRILTSELVTPD